MDIARKIAAELQREYAPQAMILYGSYAGGTFDAESDFDALLICDDAPATPRSDELHGVRLDVHFAATEQVLGEIDAQEYLQVYDGILLYDENELGQKLISAVRDYVAAQLQKTRAEKEHLLHWCDKMLQRSQRGDAEGDFRLHWLLTESLMVYCEVRNWFYFGPKKTLMRLQKEDAQGYTLYECALRSAQAEHVRAWIAHLRCFL